MSEITDDHVDEIEDAVGMGAAAWDHIDPKEIIQAIRQQMLKEVLAMVWYQRRYSPDSPNQGECISSDLDGDYINIHDLDEALKESFGNE
tara:strand:- start:1799 stop:2068 length:270 start_codon:yes stop_codon:yes gene_type:complete